MSNTAGCGWYERRSRLAESCASRAANAHEELHQHPATQAACSPRWVQAAAGLSLIPHPSEQTHVHRLPASTAAVPDPSRQPSNVSPGAHQVEHRLQMLLSCRLLE